MSRGGWLGIRVQVQRACLTCLTRHDSTQHQWPSRQSLLPRGEPGAPPALPALLSTVSLILKTIRVRSLSLSVDSMNSSFGATLLSSQVFPKSRIIFFPPSSSKSCEETCLSPPRPVARVLVWYLSPCSQKGAAFHLCCCMHSRKPPPPPNPARGILPPTLPCPRQPVP